MKKLFYFILAGLTIAGCATKEATTAVDPASLVDLRYRVGKTATNGIDSRYTEETSTYDIESDDPDPIALVVKSSKPWSIRSTHPTWCTIDVEGGQAVADSLVHLGKGENTPITIKYYNNHNLDDRLDTLIIYSDYWIGKKIFVHQAGIAYLDVESKSLPMAKNGSETVLNVLSNQKWSAEVQEGKGDKWLTIKEGTASGEGNGQVILVGQDNVGEEREAIVRIYDRHGNKMRWYVTVNQAGISLNPIGAIETDEDEYEVRGLHDQEEIAIEVVANSEWTAVKQKESDTWFSFADADPTYPGNATLRIKLTESNLSVVREAFIILKTTGETTVSKKIKVRQAYKPATVHNSFTDQDVYDAWPDSKNTSNGYVNPPQKVDNGMKLVQNCQVRREKMPFIGTYTFHWADIEETAKIKMWFYLKGSKTITFDIAKGEAKVSGISQFLNNVKSTTYDTSQNWHDLTIETTEAPGEEEGSGSFCHIVFKLDGVEFASCTTSETNDPSCVWGVIVDQLYLAVVDGGSAVLEWYDYTPPFTW